MSFRNAFKIIISKFSLVWILTLFILILGVLVGSMSLPFVLIMKKAIMNEGIDIRITEVFQHLFSGVSIDVIGQEIVAIYNSIKDLFNINKSFSLSTTLLLFLVIVFAYRFLVGFYELPMLAVLEGSMSSNARLSFFNRFVAYLRKSTKFILLKMIYTILFDFVILLILNFMLSMFSVKILAFFAPFIIMVVVILLYSLRYTFLAMWAPSVIIEEKKIVQGFIFSAKMGIKFFKNTFAAFALTFVLIISLNIFIGIFTLGAGLLISIPFSMLFISILNMTIYYGKNNKRYYVDGEIYTPPVTNDINNVKN